MNNDKLVPQIRFKGFNDAWEQCKLGEVSDIVGGGTPSTTIQEYWNGNIDWYSPIEIGNKIYVNSSQKKITKLGLDNSSAKILPIGTILFTSRAGIGNTAILKSSGCTNQGFQSIIPHQNKLDSYFIFSRSNELKSYGETMGAGSTFVEVSGKQMAEMSLMIPKFLEQKKIGIFFENLDNLITHHQHKCDKLVNIKKSMLEKMFSKNGEVMPEIRFKGFNDAWEYHKLGETKSYYTDGNYGEAYPSESDLCDETIGVPFLRGSNLKGSFLTKEGANYITKEKHNELQSGHLKEDDIVIAVRGSLGSLGLAKKENEDWNINSQLAIIRTEKNELKGSFLVQYLLSGDGQNGILSKISGSALKQLPIGQLKDIDIPITILKEQTSIGHFFKEIDDLIALHQLKLEKFRNIKKSLLNKMFV